MKGIILAGGSGTRLHPLTKMISKQLLPIYDKPMIYYPLSTLMLCGIKEILIITTPTDNSLFKKLLGDGSHIGINIQYAIQEQPRGLPEAFIIGEEFIGEDNVCLILGDNIFHSDTFINKYLSKNLIRENPTIFAYHVSNPEMYGIIEFDEYKIPISIVEKPQASKSNYAITGLYILDKSAPSIAKQLKPSQRGETEIVDLLNYYLTNQKLTVELLGRGVSWLDAGTHKGLYEASSYIETLQNRQGLKIGCIEEIAYQQKFISRTKLLELAASMQNNQYGKYLYNIANQDIS